MEGWWWVVRTGYGEELERVRKIRVGKSAQWVVRRAGQLEEGYRRMLT